MIDFPIVDDLASLLWTINLGCIDLDPVEGTPFTTVRAVAVRVRDALVALGMAPLVKTTGLSGMHVDVAIARGPLQKQVWTFAKTLAQALERLHPEIVTAEYRIARRPAQPRAAVSAPVTWAGVEAGVEIDDFRLDTMRERLAAVGERRALPARLAPFIGGSGFTGSAPDASPSR
jgi:bifunctional non-homologous end joining protein LigD